MTYQPPPPPPGTPPAGMGGRPGFDPKTINPLDWGIFGAGLLAFIFSFIDFYTYSVHFDGQSGSRSWSAWHGFFGWFAVLLVLVAVGVQVAEMFMPNVKLPAPARLIALGLYVVALLCLILAIFVVPNYGGVGGAFYDRLVDEGHGFGFWITLILVIAGLVLTLMRFQATGGQLPGGMNDRIPNLGGYGPQGGISGSNAPTSAPRPGPGPSQDYPPPPPPPPNA